MALRKDYNQAEQSAVLDKNARESWKKAQEKRKKEKETKKSTSSFGTAFADARKAGKETFMWNGKSYNTKRADDKPASKPQRAKGSEGYKPTKTDMGPNMNQVNKRPGAGLNINLDRNKNKVEKKDDRSTMQKLFGASEERRQMGRDLQKKAQASMGMGPRFGYKKGGSVKKMKQNGSVKSHRGDGICKKGKTRGRMV